MMYQEQIKKAVQEFYDVTKAFATSRHYTLSYWWVESNFGLDLNDAKVRSDVHEMSYSNDFCDLIQCLDFDNDKKEVLIMIWESNNKKKYTIKDYKEFSNNVLVIPPLEEFEDGTINEAKWYEEHKIHIIVGQHDMEIDYTADAVNEIDSVLDELHDMECDESVVDKEEEDDEYRDATWKDILKADALSRFYKTQDLDLKGAIHASIQHFTRERFIEIMKELEETESLGDEIEVNFAKLDTRDLHKIFNMSDRKQVFKEMLCQKIEIEELVDKDGRTSDRVVITDYSMRFGGDIVGWHYGVDWDKDSKDNQYYIQNYIKEMTE